MKIFIYDENRVLMRTVGTPDIMQGENNATLIFMSVAGIDETNFQNYLAQFAATIGTSHPADIITDFGTYVLDGVEYKGWKYFVSSKFTQVAGALNANLILSSGGSTLISQTVTLNVNPSASGVTWFKNITQAQWEQLLAYTIGLKNPKVGVIADSYLDTYNSEGQAGSYFYFGEDGVPHLLFVGYNEDDDLIAQTDYYSDGGAMYCRSRTFSDGEWTEWETSDQASAISVNVSGLPQLTGANTVQKAIAALAHAVYPIAFVTSLTPSPFTSVDVPNSKDKIIKDDLGQDLNVGGVLDYAFAIFGRYNTHAFGFDNTLIMTSDGAIYRMKYENGSMVAHWFNGSPAQVKAEQAIINQTLSDGIATNNNLIKHSVVGNSAMTMDPDTYVITITNYSLSGEVLNRYEVDIPAEMAFVSASYDNTTKDLTFTLQNGNEVVVPLDDIVSGLASEAWVNTAIANALLPYATTSWVDSNYMSLTKGGVVNLANPPASGSTFYFGAKNGTTSLFEVSDHAILGKVTGNTGEVWHFNMNGNANSAPIFTHIIPAYDDNPTRTTQYKLPLNVATGSHDLVIDDDLDEANAKIASLESKTAKQESDIQYLYRQVIGGGDLVTETDSGVALTSQNFPLTVSPKALLDYVGGMCQKVNQLIRNGNFASNTIWNVQQASKTISGNKCTIYTNGSGIASELYQPINIKASHSYLVHFKLETNDSVSYYLGGPISNQVTYTTPSVVSYIKTTQSTIPANNYFDLYIDNEAQKVVLVSNAIIADLTAIYGAGNEPTSTSDPRIQWLISYLSSHPEYDAGSILTAPVTSVKSMGANVIDWSLFPAQSYTHQALGGEFEINSEGVWKITGGASQSYVINPHTAGSTPAFSLKAGTYKFSVKAVNGTVPTNQAVVQIKSVGGNQWYPLKNGDTFTLPQNDEIIVYAWISTTAGSFSFMPMLSRGTNAVEYTPYRAPIEYPVPAEVRALEGYGYGINDTLYNYIDYDRKVFVKKVARVDLGSLDWGYLNGKFVAKLQDAFVMQNTSDVAPVLCTKYKESSISNIVNQSETGITLGSVGFWGGGKVAVYDSAYSDVATFKTAMSGVYLYYELATPVETDISEYIESDVIVVSAGGHLEFENENDMGVPYSATYQCEPETQGGE